MKLSPQAHLNSSGKLLQTNRAKVQNWWFCTAQWREGCSDYPKWGPAPPSLALLASSQGTSFIAITKRDIICSQAEQDSARSFSGSRQNANGFCGRRMCACVHLSLSQCCSLSLWVQHHFSFPSPSGALFTSFLPPSCSLSETISQWLSLHQKESMLVTSNNVCLAHSFPPS